MVTRMETRMETIETQYVDLIPGKVYYIYQPSTTYLKDDCYVGMFVKKNRLGDHLVSHFRDVSALEPLEYMGDGNFGKTEKYIGCEKVIPQKHCNEIIHS